jgi:hypothetical protein
MAKERKSIKVAEMKKTVTYIANSNIDWILSGSMEKRLIQYYENRTEGQLSMAHVLGILTNNEYQTLSNRLGKAAHDMIYGEELLLPHDTEGTK